jgi:hypothetical protein
MPTFKKRIKLPIPGPIHALYYGENNYYWDLNDLELAGLSHHDYVGTATHSSLSLLPDLIIHGKADCGPLPKN